MHKMRGFFAALRMTEHKETYAAFRMTAHLI